MTNPNLLIFTLDRLRYALELDSVRRVVQAAAITPLPQAPEIVLGILDLHGELLPVINLRKRFRLPERDLSCGQQFVIARSAARTVALVVDGTEGVMERAGLQVTSPEEIVEGTAHLEGVISCADGMILIHNLETLLFPDEEKLLAEALDKVAE